MKVTFGFADGKLFVEHHEGRRIEFDAVGGEPKWTELIDRIARDVEYQLKDAARRAEIPAPAPFAAPRNRLQLVMDLVWQRGRPSGWSDRVTRSGGGSRPVAIVERDGKTRVRWCGISFGYGDRDPFLIARDGPWLLCRVPGANFWNGLAVTSYATSSVEIVHELTGTTMTEREAGKEWRAAQAEGRRLLARVADADRQIAPDQNG